MAAVYANQLQPWEENQSPSPTEERTDPFTTLQRARSGGSHKTPPSPSSPINSLHRQLSGDPDHPPPAWQRRSSFRDGKNPSRSPSKGTSMSSASASPPLAHGQTNNVNAGQNGLLPNQPVPPAQGRTSRSPSDASSASGISGGVRPNLPPQTRRHPHLTMTTSTPGLMGNDLYSHDSPHGSSSSLNDPVLLPPNPAFAGKGNRGSRSASARSSMHTLNSMTSEELWTAEPDMSNPHRPSHERPLDTVRKDRRNSQVSTRNSIMTTPAYQMDMMSPPELEEVAMGGKRSKSTTNVQSLSRRSSRLTLSRKKRQSTVDIPSSAQAHPPSKANSILNSSANSSLTDIPGQKVHRNPSYGSLGGRPPSSFLYDSRSFLTQMAPLEGGYAIAAAISSPPQGSQNNSPVGSPIEARHRGDAIRNSRPPVSRSAGMARWSLDGGEHYGTRSFGNASAAGSTTSNLAAPPIMSGSPQPSPESEEMSSISMHSLPDGASPPVGSMASAPMSPNASIEQSPPQNMVSSIPVNPSPLSQSVTKDQPIQKSGTQSTITSNAEGVVAPTPVPAAGLDGSDGRAALPAGAATPIAAGQSAESTSGSMTPSNANANDKGKNKAAQGAATPNTQVVAASTKGADSKLSAKDAKAAEKAEKAEQARKAKEAEEKRRAGWEKAQKAKAEQKAKEKEEKKRAKKEKGGLSGLFGLGGKKEKVQEKGQEKTKAHGEGEARIAGAAAGRMAQQQPQSAPKQQQQQQAPQQQAQPVWQAAPDAETPARQGSPARPGPVRQANGQRPPAERIPSSSNIASTPPSQSAQSTLRQGTKPFPGPRPASQLMPSAAAAVAEPRQRGAGSLPSDARAPKPTPGSGPAAAAGHKEEKKKLGFFGTIRRRFSSNPSTATVKSEQKNEQKPPVPAMPANVGSVRSQAGAAGAVRLPQPPAPPPQIMPPMTPPRSTAAAQPIPTLAAPVATPDNAPVASADLPPRSTSVRGSPANVASPNLELSPSQHASPAGSNEGETGSRHGIPNSPSPLSRTRGSIKGPRPMPRPASAASGSRSVRSASVSASAASPKVDGEHAATESGANANGNAASFPFHKPSADHAASIDPAALAHEHEHAGTESSGLSQVPSHFTSSDGTGGYDVLATPWSSEEGDVNGVGSGQMRERVQVAGQGSEGGEVHEVVQGKKEMVQVPERDGSADTVRAIVA